MQRMIDFYNAEVLRYGKLKSELSHQTIDIDTVITSDTSQISWNVELKKDLSKLLIHQYHPKHLTKALYRPFTKTNLLYDKHR